MINSVKLHIFEVVLLRYVRILDYKNNEKIIKYKKYKLTQNERFRQIVPKEIRGTMQMRIRV